MPSCIVVKKTGKTGKTGKTKDFVHVVLLLRDLGKLGKLEKLIISCASCNLRKLIVIHNVVYASEKILGICFVLGICTGHRGPYCIFWTTLRNSLAATGGWAVHSGIV